MVDDGVFSTPTRPCGVETDGVYAFPVPFRACGGGGGGGECQRI